MDEQMPVQKSFLEKMSVPIAIVIAGGLMGGALYYSNLKAKEVKTVIESVQISQDGSSNKMQHISS